MGRILLKYFEYGALMLRVQYPDLEMSYTRLIYLRDQPFFFIIDRYRVLLTQIKKLVFVGLLLYEVLFLYGGGATDEFAFKNNFS